jgi:hypothetical protein
MKSFILVYSVEQTVNLGAKDEKLKEYEMKFHTSRILKKVNFIFIKSG